MTDLEGQTQETEAPEVEKQETPPLPALPEQYQGKTPEELVKIIKDKEDEFGRQSNEVGDLRDQVNNLEGQRQQAQYQQQVQSQYPPQEQQQGQEEQGLPDSEYPNAGDTRKIITQELQKHEWSRQQENAQRSYYDAQTAFMEGRENAIRGKPKLFEGIEKEVEHGVWQMYASNPNNPSAASNLRNPQFWNAAAKYLRVERNEFDVLKPPVGQPMAHTKGEVPSTVKTSEPEKTVTFTSDMKEILKGVGEGVTEEEAATMIEEERAVREKDSQ